MKALSESFRLSPLKSSTSNALSNNNFLKSRDEVVRFLLGKSICQKQANMDPDTGRGGGEERGERATPKNGANPVSGGG